MSIGQIKIYLRVIFDSYEEELGFNDYIGEFELEDCSYKVGSEEYSKWLKGWIKAKNNPYVIANIEYYRSQL